MTPVQVLEPVVASALSKFDCAHEVRHQGPLLSGLRCWEELVDGVIMNKKWQIHEKCSCVHPEILDSAFMSSAISAAFSHGWGRRLGSWHFFFCAVSKCCGSSAAIRMSRHLCLSCTVIVRYLGCRRLVLSDISLPSHLWRFTEFRRSGWTLVTVMKHASAGSRTADRLWTSLCALTFTGFCCNIWYYLSTWTSLFPPLQEFLPFLAFKGLLMDSWWKFPILKYPDDSSKTDVLQHRSWDKAHFAKSSLFSSHCAKKPPHHSPNQPC